MKRLIDDLQRVVHTLEKAPTEYQYAAEFARVALKALMLAEGIREKDAPGQSNPEGMARS